MTVRLLEPIAAAERVEITYEAHNLSVAVASSVNALATLDCVYQQDRTLMMAQRGEDGLALHEMTRAVARDVLTDLVVFKSFKVQSKKLVSKAIAPPDPVVDAVLQRPDRWREAGIREALGVNHLPCCNADGSLIAEGYSAKYRRIVDFNGKTYPAPGSTKEDAIAAFERVSDLMIDFPFTTELDRLVAVSLLIAAVHRALMRVCPAYLIDSPSPEIGKSLIVDLASALVSGRRAQTINPTADHNELRKSIFSMLVSGSQHIAIDNIDMTFGGAPFDILITQETYPDRVLGASKMRAPSTVALVTLTGRNVRFAGDGALRTVRSQLSTVDERPGTSTAKRKHPRIFEYLIAKREQLVSDCVTIARAYLLAGRPNPTSMREFDDWCMRVREPLIWLGKADIADSVENVRQEGDEATSAIIELMEAWYAIYEDDPVTMMKVVKEIRNPPSYDRPKFERLHDAFESFGVDPMKTDCIQKVGYKLRPNVGRPFGGLMFKRGGRSGPGTGWMVIKQKKAETKWVPVGPSTPDRKPSDADEEDFF